MKILKPKISKKKIMIFSVFVFIATIFWFLNALNKEYITKIDYPISFYNFPKNVISPDATPEALSVSINANGFDILWKFGISTPLKINVLKYAVKDKSDNRKLTITTNKLSDDLFPDITGIKIISIKPETIIFETKNILSRKVPVKLNISFSTKELYMQSGPIKFSPDSVIIYAAKEEIINHKFVESEIKNFKELNDSLFIKVKLKKIKNSNFSKNEIDIIIPIEKYTEKTTLVPILIENCPDSLRVVTFPNESKVTYRVTLSRFDSVSWSSFKLLVNYNDILEKKPNKLQIYLKEFPKDIKSIKLSPEYLEYVIEKDD